MKKVVVVLLVLIMGLVPASIFAKDANLALSAGLGFVYPMGDMGEIDNAISLPISIQYAVMPNLSVEFDAYYYIITSEAVSDVDYSQYQFGLGARYWLEKAFNGIYFGAGLARTNVEIEMDMPFLGKVTFEDDFNTLVLKGGYAMKLDPIIVDFGLRYDAIDMDNWADQPLTIYAMAVYPLSI